MRQAFILLSFILASTTAFATQLHCIGYCQLGSAAPTGVRATGAASSSDFEALRSATAALLNLCASPRVLSGIKCVGNGSHDNGLNSANYRNSAQAQSATPIIGGARSARSTERNLGTGIGLESYRGSATTNQGSGNTRKDSAY